MFSKKIYNLNLFTVCFDNDMRLNVRYITSVLRSVLVRVLFIYLEEENCQSGYYNCHLLDWLILARPCNPVMAAHTFEKMATN